MSNVGIDLHTAQMAGETSPLFWATKAILLMFEKGELVGKLGKMEIYTVSENGKHSVFAWVKVGMEAGRDLFIGTASEPVNMNDVVDAWL